MLSNTIEKMIKYIIVLMILPFSILFSNENIESSLEKARNLYYDSVENEESIDKAIDIFREVADKSPDHKGLSETYIGSLTALKAKYTFWPHNKLDYANEGIALMEKGIKKCPENIEALFIQGSTLHYLPFFFRKGDEAESNFRKIISLVNEGSVDKYGNKLIENALKFIIQNYELDDKEKSRLNTVIDNISET